jgi:UDP-perosamine 4-acetyltransferase
MEDAVIYGAGGLGGLVHDILQQAGLYRAVAFLDSDPVKAGVFSGLPVLRGPHELPRFWKQGVRKAIVAIGDGVTRVSLAETLAARGFDLISAIHPLASIAPSAKLGAHVIIGPRATICVHGRIGAHCVISAGAIAEHDNVLGKGVFLEPAVRLAGGVLVGDFAVVGIGAAVIPGRRIGAGARIEPGAVVIRDVPPRRVVGGVPANSAAIPPSRFVPSVTAVQPAGDAHVGV